MNKVTTKHRRTQESLNENDLSSELSVQIDEGMLRIRDFVQSEGFMKLYTEVMRVTESRRHEFLDVVLSDPAILKAYGIIIPDGMKIQKSEFADGRPTLFCVTAYLPKGLAWRKVTLTFDNADINSFQPVDKSRLESAESAA